MTATRKPSADLAIIGRRMAAQRLTGKHLERPEQVVSWLVGVQAQEYAEAKWSLGLRTAGTIDADVEAALERGDILRTHVLRPTWHFVTPADVRWLLRLTRPRVHRLNASWYARSGLDATTLARVHEILARTLADGRARTRRELAERLSSHGIARSGLALGYLLMHAELEEVICSGPRAGGKHHTYTLLDRRAPESSAGRQPQGEDAVDQLVLPSVRSRGPATAADVSTWSSLTLTAIRASLQRLADRLECEHDPSGDGWYSDPAAPPGDRVGGFLLPMYDELTIGYRNLRVVLAFPPAAQPLERPIIVDGHTVGSWKRRANSRGVTVEPHLFGTLTRHQTQAVASAVDAYNRFADFRHAKRSAR